MKYLFPAVLLLAIVGCNKTETVVIPDNTAPPDFTIEAHVIDNYANKTYISLLGREPSNDELASARTALNANGFSETDRSAFVDEVLAKDGYLGHHYNIALAEYLNDLDTNEISSQVFVFNLLLLDTNLAPFHDQFLAEIVRLEEMRDIPKDLNNGSLSIQGMFYRCANNSFYDELNMGSENFVNACFENWLLRFPTLSELENGILMVDGFNGVVFLEAGESKEDFLNIFFYSKSYYEGQVNYLFNRYLFRLPNSDEMSYYAELYEQSDDYKTLQKAILITAEFAGL